MSPPGEEHPPFPEQSSEKIKNIDKTHALRLCSLFKSLNRWEIISISRLTRLVEIKKGEIVYREGEVPQSFYIVVSGRFEVFQDSQRARKILAYLKQGAYFGEISLLTGGVHSATVQALSDSLVLEIAKDDFQRKVQHHPSIALEMGRVLGTRLQKGEKPQLLRSDFISVYSAHRRTDHTSFCINLAASLHRETGRRTLLVDMSPSGSIIWGRLHIEKRIPLGALRALEEGIDEILSQRLVSHDSGVEVLNLATEEAPADAEEHLTHLLNRLAVDFRFIVIDLPSQMDPLIIKVLTQSDEIFLVTDNHMPNVTEIREVMTELERSIAISDVKIKIIINESFLGFTPTNETKKELFGEKDCYFLPQVSLSAEERLNPEEQSLTVIQHPEREYSMIVRQIARKVSRNLVGLALGSGAALGFAHIGVIKVLERERIPIDFIAGSSIGALVAAFYAAGKSASEMEAIAGKINRFRWLSLVDFSPMPVRGIIRGREIYKFIQSYLRDISFEDTKIPLYIIATNLTAREEWVMNSGSLVQALRASVAIPGIFDPVIVKGEVIIDGGVINPLPVRPLIEAGVNKIIAVDVLPTAEDILERRRYQEVLKKKRDEVIRSRPWIIRALYSVPRFLGRCLTPNLPDIIINSMQMMEHEIAEGAGADADVLIRPSLPLAHWFEFHRSKTFIRRGEEAAEAALEEVRALVRQQNY